MRLTKKQQAALDYFGLVFAKSEERGAGWFAYDDSPYGLPTKNNYPGSSCECIEDVVEWYESRRTLLAPDKGQAVEISSTGEAIAPCG